MLNSWDKCGEDFPQRHGVFFRTRQLSHIWVEPHNRWRLSVTGPLFALICNLRFIAVKSCSIPITGRPKTTFSTRWIQMLPPKSTDRRWKLIETSEHMNSEKGPNFYCNRDPIGTYGRQGLKGARECNIYDKIAQVNRFTRPRKARRCSIHHVMAGFEPLLNCRRAPGMIMPSGRSLK